MNIYQFHSHPTINANLLPDKQVRNIPKFIAQALARAAWENGVRNVPIDIEPDPSEPVMLLTDWINYSETNWTDALQYAMALCGEYSHRFSTENDDGITYDKKHPAYAEIKAMATIHVANLPDHGGSRWPCFLVDYAEDITSSYIEQMRLTYAVTDSSKAKWSRREKPDFVSEWADTYNEYIKRAKQRAKLRSSKSDKPKTKKDNAKNDDKDDKKEPAKSES